MGKESNWLEGTLITKGNDMGRMGEGESKSFPKTLLSPMYRWRNGGSEGMSDFLKVTWVPWVQG